MTDPVDRQGQDNDPIDAQFEPAPPSADHVVTPKTPRKGPGWLALIATGVLATLLGGGIGAGIGGAGDKNSATNADTGDLSASIAALEDQQNRLGSRIAALAADLEQTESSLATEISDLAKTAGDQTGSGTDEDLSGAMAALSARVDLLSALPEPTGEGEDTGPLSARLLAFEQALADVQTAQGNRAEALAGLSARLDTAETAMADAGANVDGAQLLGLHEDISALKAELAEVLSQTDAGPDGRTALAMLSLEAASDQGTPFADVLPVLVEANADAGVLADLRVIARTGAPTLDKLQNTFYGGLLSARALENGDTETSSDTAPADDGWGWVRRTFGDSVKITRSDSSGSEGRGTDALEEVAERAGDALLSGNLTGAIAMLDDLDEAEHEAFAPWLEGADRRLRLDAALIALRASLLEQER